MKWLEISIKVPADLTEVIADLFFEYGHQGVSIDHLDLAPDAYTEPPPAEFMIVRAYVPDDDRTQATRELIETALEAYEFTPTYVVIDEQDWAEAWKAHYHTTRIGERIVVRPEWEEAEIQADDIEIVMDPGMAFGTGTHSTTRLCLMSIEEMMRPGLQVLDLGCGSGILSIAAAKLGASKILAVDIDPLAVKSTEENIVRNGVAAKITAQEGSLQSVVGSARRFDFLLANILARIIIPMCDEGLGQVVRPGGKAVFSGLIRTQEEEVRQALERAGLVPFNARYEGDWVALDAYRPN